MNIAIDAREYRENSAGKGRYVKEVIKALAKLDYENNYILLTDSSDSPDVGNNFKWVNVPQSIKMYFSIDKILKQNNVDLLFSPTSFLAPLFTGVKSIIVVHDLAVFLEPRAKPSPKTRIIEKIGLPLALEKSQKIISVSQTTKNDLVRHFKISENKIFVVPNAPFNTKVKPINCPETLRKYQLNNGYLLFVGTLEPRKNIFNLISAYANLPIPLKEEYPLVLAGKRGWNINKLDFLIDRLNLNKYIIELGFIPDEELDCLYSGATIFIYPSWYEGFGLPVLEAMQRGTPVITSTAPALVEISQKSALHIEPSDVGGLTDAIQKLLENKNSRTKLSIAGLEQVKKYSWENTARSIIDIMESTK